MDFFIGFVANAISTTIVNPVDVIKTNYQINNMKSRKEWTGNTRTSVSSIVRNIYRLDSLKGFYRGLLPNLSTYPVFWSVFFGLKGTKLDNYKFINFEDNDELNKYTNKSISTLISASIASTLANPIFVVKTKLQASEQASTSITTITHRLYKEEGMRAYFRGLNATLLNNSKLCVQFPMIDYLKEKYDMNPFTSSLIARTSMTALFYPLDNIRTNQRNFAGLSMSDVAKQMYRHYGPLGFYRGVLLYSMTSTPNFVLMVTIKEMLESYLK
jgi:hypothetical protein